MLEDSAGSSAAQAEKEEADSRSIYVGNVSSFSISTYVVPCHWMQILTFCSCSGLISLCKKSYYLEKNNL